MKTLMIKDLALTAELDRKAMAAVHGGRALPSYAVSPSYLDLFSHNDNSSRTTTNVTKTNTFVQQIDAGLAFADHSKQTITATQIAF